MRARSLILALALTSSVGVACSLITALDAARTSPSSEAGAAPCDAGACQPVVIASFPAGTDLTDLYIDARTGQIFVAGTAAGTVFVVSADAGADARATAAATGLSRPVRLAGEGERTGRVVYASAMGPGASTGLFVLTDDGGARPLASGSVNVAGVPWAVRPYGVVIAPPFSVLWTNNPGLPDAASQVLSTDQTGTTSAIATLAEGPAHDVTSAPNGDVWWNTAAGSLYHLVGRAPTQAATGAGIFTYVPASTSGRRARVYFTTENGNIGDILALDAEGAAPTPAAFVHDPSMVAVNQPAALASDGAYLYWTNHGNSTIARAPLTGGSPEVVYASPQPPRHLAFFDGSLFWTTDTTVVRALLPP